LGIVYESIEGEQKLDKLSRMLSRERASWIDHIGAEQDRIVVFAGELTGSAVYSRFFRFGVFASCSERG
jgi:hypothetical protein